MTPDEAALFLGMPRRVLYQHLLLCRHGERLGFNMEAHMHLGVGCLRSFIRIKKRQQVFDEDLEKPTLKR